MSSQSNKGGGLLVRFLKQASISTKLVLAAGAVIGALLIVAAGLVAQKANADPQSQWYLVQNAVEGGRTLSAAPLCGNGQLCPWSLHYA